MSSYHLKVTAQGGELHVSGGRGLTKAGHPHLALRASAVAVPNLTDAAGWPVGLAWSITDRVRSRGDAKGRVLAIWQESPGTAPVAVAALAWHTHGSGPLYVLDAGHDTTIDADLGRRLTERLLTALLEVAAHPSASVAPEWQHRLRWSQVALKRAPHTERADYRRANLRRAAALGFVKYQPPPVAADWTKGAWLGERAF